MKSFKGRGDYTPYNETPTEGFTMPLVPHTFERTTSVADGGGTTYIRIIKTDEEVSIYKSNTMGQSKVTWSLDEAHEILDMLFVVLD